MIPAALGLLLAAFPPQRWPAVIAAWGAVGSVAAALGPPIGGLLSDGASWRWIFVINVPVGIATVLVGLRMLRESRAAETARPDVPGGVLLTNDALLEVPDIALRSGGYVTVPFSGRPGDGERMIWYIRSDNR